MPGRASGLSFLDLGVAPPSPEWGALLDAGRNYITQAWWLEVMPGVAIVVFALSAPRRPAGVPRHDRPDHPAGPPGSSMRSIAPDAKALPASTSTTRNFSDEDPR